MTGSNRGQSSLLRLPTSLAAHRPPLNRVTSSIKREHPSMGRAGFQGAEPKEEPKELLRRRGELLERSFAPRRRLEDIRISHCGEYVLSNTSNTIAIPLVEPRQDIADASAGAIMAWNRSMLLPARARSNWGRAFHSLDKISTCRRGKRASPQMFRSSLHRPATLWARAAWPHNFRRYGQDLDVCSVCR
jgi:hypothetical protein